MERDKFSLLLKKAFVCPLSLKVGTKLTFINPCSQSASVPLLFLDMLHLNIPIGRMLNSVGLRTAEFFRNEYLCFHISFIYLGFTESIIISRQYRRRINLCRVPGCKENCNGLVMGLYNVW